MLFLLRIFPLSIALMLNSKINSQDIKITYKCTKQIIFSNEENNFSKAVDFEYKSIMLLSNNAYLIYKKPLYLNKYPSNELSFETVSNKLLSFKIFADSLQGISYFNLDSMIWRYRVDASPFYTGKNFVRKIENSFNSNWEYTNEIKKINGFNCQKIKLYRRNTKELIYEAWFTKDVLINYGPLSFLQTPGLIVDLYVHPTKEHYLLESINQLKLSSKDFWLPEFSKYGFQEISPLK